MYNCFHFNCFNAKVFISPCRLHGVSIQLGEEALYASIDHQLQSVGIKDVKARDLVDITSDYVELGFGKSTKEELGKDLYTLDGIVNNVCYLVLHDK